MSSDKPRYAGYSEVTSVIATADVVRSDNTVFNAQSLRSQHNGVNLFWDEDRKTLSLRTLIAKYAPVLSD